MSATSSNGPLGAPKPPRRGNGYPAQIYGQHNRPTADHPEQWARDPTIGDQQRQSQRLLFSSSQRYAQESASGQSPSWNPQKNYSMRQIIEQDTIQLKQQLNNVAKKLGSQANIPPHVRSALEAELRSISEKYWRFSVNCLAEFDKLTKDRLKLLKQVDDQQHLIQKAITEKDRAYAKLADTQRQHKHEIADLRNELSVKEQQVYGRSSLWVLTSGARRAREPFSTPPAASLGNVVEPGTMLKKSKSSKMTSDASEASSLVGDSALHNQPNTRNLGDKIESTALVPFRTEEQIAAEFSKEFEMFYELAERWVRTHTNIVPNANSASDRSVPYGSDLYSRMLRSCHNPSETATGHVASLLKDALGRPMLFFRVLISYVKEEMWTARAFMGMIETHSRKLKEVEKDLEAKGLTSERRAKVVNMQTQVISSIIEHEGYPAFRIAQLSKHSASLRQLLGTLLIPDMDRTAAGRDLSQLVGSASNLATKMLVENRTFFIRFPDSGSRFNHTWMISEDPKIKESPLDLHLGHARVRLTITPAITMRNDLNQTIETSPVQLSRVLVTK